MTVCMSQLAEEERKKMRQEKEDLESEMAFSTSSSAEGELSVLKQAKRELEGKVVELEDELDELKFRSESFQQVKARLELANKTLRQQQQKELESREEELEAVKSTMNKKVPCKTSLCLTHLCAILNYPLPNLSPSIDQVSHKPGG